MGNDYCLYLSSCFLVLQGQRKFSRWCGFNPILLTLSLENVEYFKNGTGAPHIVNAQFQDLFATFGGAGSTLPLLIAMLIVCRSKRIKELGKLALVPRIFGINEPIIFGPYCTQSSHFYSFCLSPNF